jgi:hypothetical protein
VMAGHRGPGWAFPPKSSALYVFTTICGGHDQSRYDTAQEDADRCWRSARQPSTEGGIIDRHRRCRAPRRQLTG